MIVATETSSDKISIHAPRVGCDAVDARFYAILHTFQSTHPVWGATHGVALFQFGDQISIHAPRVGCDAIATDRLLSRR